MPTVVMMPATETPPTLPLGDREKPVTYRSWVPQEQPAPSRYCLTGGEGTAKTGQRRN